MKAHLSLIAAAAAFGLAACASSETTTASAGAPADRDCFNTRQVSGYGVIDDNNIRVTAGANRNYILHTNWNARDLDWTHAIALRGNGDWICTGNGLGVSIIGGDPIRRTYPVDTITREPDLNAVQGS